MPDRCRAWQLEALALLHQVCRGISAKTPPARRGKTIAERARESVFSRLMDILSQIIAVEEDLYTCVSRYISVFPKDSIDLKNICLRMAEDDASPTDRDLRDLQGCLKSIAENLSSMCNENVASNDFVILKIKQIYDNFPDMW